MPSNPQTEQQETAVLPANASPPSAPLQGGRIAFRSITRTLSDQELASPGVLKLILEMLETADRERDEFKAYLPLYFDADKRASILAERLDNDRTNEILSGVLLAGGGALIGLAPFFWDPNNLRGEITLAVGAIFIIGAAVARKLYKAKK